MFSRSHEFRRGDFQLYADSWMYPGVSLHFCDTLQVLLFSFWTIFGLEMLFVIVLHSVSFAPTCRVDVVHRKRCSGFVQFGANKLTREPKAAQYAASGHARQCKNKHVIL